MHNMVLHAAFSPDHYRVVGDDLDNPFALPHPPLDLHCLATGSSGCNMTLLGCLKDAINRPTVAAFLDCPLPLYTMVTIFLVSFGWHRFPSYVLNCGPPCYDMLMILRLPAPSHPDEIVFIFAMKCAISIDTAEFMEIVRVRPQKTVEYACDLAPGYCTSLAFFVLLLPTFALFCAFDKPDDFAS
jgi:hypothetical protein